MTQRKFQLNPTDLSVKVPGGGINVSRFYYNDQWHLGLNSQTLRFEQDSLGELETIYLSEVPYEASSNNASIFINGTYRIVSNGSGYRWETRTGKWKEFDATGRLLSSGNRTGVIGSLLYEPGDVGRVSGIADRNGNQVVWYAYTDDTTTVTDTEGRLVTYTFTNGLLTSVKRYTNHATGVFSEETYEYDTEGRIITIIDANGNEKHIGYDAYGNIISELDANGVGKLFEYGYDNNRKEYYAMVRTTSGMIKERWFDEKGETLRLDINGRTISKTVKDGRNRIITDENGNVTRKEYDEWNNLTRVVYPDGSFVTYEYEHTWHRRIRETNELGVVTEFSYSYDTAGNMIQKIKAVGTPDERVTEFAYDTAGHLLTIKIVSDAQTAEANTVMTYDDFGNMTSLTDPEGHMTRFTAYDALGNVLTKIDARGNTWNYEYDGLGRMTKMTDPMGHETSYEYDANGNMTMEIDAEGKVTRYDYDERNNLITIIDAVGNASRFEYDTDNNRIREVDQEGKQINYEYDNEGRLIKTIDGNGNETAMAYEAVADAGCASCRGGAGRYEPSAITYSTFTKRFTYDVRGRKIAEYDVLSETEEYVTQYEYDLAGNLIQQIDKESNATQYEYDALNRKVKTIDALGGETVYTYDDRDNLIALQDANGNVTQFEYDRNKRKTKEIRPHGRGDHLRIRRLGQPDRKDRCQESENGICVRRCRKTGERFILCRRGSQHAG